MLSDGFRIAQPVAVRVQGNPQPALTSIRISYPLSRCPISAFPNQSPHSYFKIVPAQHFSTTDMTVTQKMKMQVIIYNMLWCN